MKNNMNKSQENTKKKGSFDNTLKMKELPVYDQPYEKLERDGEISLSDTELIAIILKSGIKGTSAISLSQQVQSLDFQKQGISFLCHIPIDDLKSIPGIGRVKAIQIKACVELGRRVARNSPSFNEAIIKSPSDIVKYVQEEMQQLPNEELRIALLDNKNALMRIIKSASGNVKSTMFSPREIFKDALKYNASSMILLHNHPSGNPYPSQSDFKTTLILSKLAKELDIPILDHIIIARNGYESIQSALILKDASKNLS